MPSEAKRWVFVRKIFIFITLNTKIPGFQEQPVTIRCHYKTGKSHEILFIITPIVFG